VERCIYSLTDSANACRAAQRLSNRYWWLALSHASDVHNHIPTATNDGVPPITAATGAPPNLHQFRIFGCDAYVVRAARQEMRAASGRKGLNVGYDSTSGTHKVIFPPSRDMTVGDTRLMQARTTQIGALPKKYQQSQRKTIHVRFNDTVLPPAVINGEVHPTSPTYRPFHPDDKDPKPTGPMTSDIRCNISVSDETGDGRQKQHRACARFQSMSSASPCVCHVSRL